MSEAHGGTSRPRLLVVDDHPLMREAITATLGRETSLEVVGEAEDGQEALRLCRELRPDLILMDVSMPNMGGIEATTKIKAEFPLTSVLILTAHADHRLLMDAVKAGAAGYVLKGKPRDLLEAVRAVLGGETPLDQTLAMSLLRSLGQEEAARSSTTRSTTRTPPEASSSDLGASSSLHNTLTSREAEVLSRLASGKTNRQIAQELMVSYSTVKTYVQRIIRKLGVSDRTQASVRAIEMGLLPGSE